MKNRTIIGIVCMILAVAMTFAIAPVVNRLTSDTTTVVRLKQEVGRGTKITEDQVETVKVKTDTMPQGVYVNTADVVGKYASSTLYAGDILTKAKLSGDSNNADDVLATLNGSKVAVSVTIDTFAAGLSGKLQNGDIISLSVVDKNAGTSAIENIENILSGVYKVDALSDVAKKLYEHGFLVEDFVDESQIVEYLFNKEIYGNKTLELTIIPTNACNFDCVYCYQKEPYFFMSKETMDSIIFYIEKHIGEYTGLLISWFGGEPLLAKELMVEFMEKVRMICLKKHIPFYSNVTTNGYELDLKTFKSLIKNHVLYYQITIDGPKEIHNKQRPHKTNSDSFEKIVKNLMDIKENVKGNRYKIAVRVNISTSVQPYIEDFIEWLYNKFGNDSRFTIVWEIVRDWGGEKIKNNQNHRFNRWFAPPL